MSREYLGQVEALDEASEMRKKKLKNVLQKLMSDRKESDKRVQCLQERRRKVLGKEADETEKVTALFGDLRRRLDDLEKRVLSEISVQAKRVSISLDDLIHQLEIKKDELSRKMEDIEELCKITDSLTVLQKSLVSDSCKTKDGDEDRERHDKLLHDGGDLDVAGISHTLCTGLSDIMSGVNVPESLGTHFYPHSIAKGKGHIDAELSCARHQPCPAGEPDIGVVQQTSRLSVTDILLEVSTAGNYVHISDDRKTASWSYDSQKFQHPQVLSSQSFSSGHHYLDVDVGGSVYWSVGMCYASIDRRGDQSLIGCNKKSWCLERRGDNPYLVRYDRKKIRLPGKVASNRVRIDLDYEAGQISFYHLCDPIQHLHTFTTTFAEPLHAALYVGEGSCMKLSVGNQ